MRFSASTFSALAALPLLTTAHVKIESPVPYGAGNGAPALDTNPLLASGADFPCKQRPEVYKLVKENILPLNVPQTLSFQGQATHGGGSCQISLSRDREPTKNSVWKVIHSIEGGCPSKNPGNVGNDPFGFGADKFQYSVPGEVPEGKYTLAFTWFNKIGNREMYMNCAPVTVTGGSKAAFVAVNGTSAAVDGNDGSSASGIQQRADAFDALPNMFVANIGNGCSTAHSGTDLQIPEANLGKYVQRINTGPLTPPIGNCGSSSSGGAAGQAVPVASPSVAKPKPTPSTSTSTVVVQPTPSTSTSTLAPAVIKSTLSTSTSTATPAAVHTPATQPTPSSAPEPAVPAGLTTGSCPTPGKSVCSSDGGSIGTCDENHVVIYQKVPEGTRCDPSLGVEVHARRSRIQR